jgi:hypothetical protein
MGQPVTEAEARAALATVEEGRRQALEQIGMPSWYWWGLALGWVGLGAINDLKIAWLGATATVLFGAAHASAFSIVAGGRRPTRRFSVRAETAGWYPAAAVIACLLGLAGVTIVGALVARADGAGHPVTIASVPVAVAIVLGGPRLMDALRRRATRVRGAA